MQGRYALSKRNGIICEVERGLRRCGYSSELLRKDYGYEDDKGKYTVPLVGFYRAVCDSRSSCVSVVECNDPLGVTAEYVNRYRGLGAPVVFATS